MTLHYQDARATIYHGDCIEVMRQLPDNSVDSIVTDPPYGLEFMGKGWDSFSKSKTVSQELSPSMAASTTPKHKIRGKKFEQDWGQLAFQAWFTEVATEALRVLKPGGHLLAFGGTRTWHRLAVAIEDAGFEVRDSIAWMYGSGFPKSLDVSKAIDKAAGADRQSLGVVSGGGRMAGNGYSSDDYNGGWHGVHITAPATPAAQQWQGWGTALKPAFEPIVVARKPLIGTVAANVLTYGTGALNIDGCRIGTDGGTAGATAGPSDGIYGNGLNGQFSQPVAGLGRWPANVILDESQAAALDKQSGVTNSKAADRGQQGGIFRLHGFSTLTELEAAVKRGEKCPDGRDAVETLRRYRLSADRDNWGGHTDTGGASRFFYCAKAGKKERPNVDGIAHPTVKPLRLMEYLCRLVTPPGGTILEPFAGSGTTIEAALNEGFNVIGIEMTDEYLPLIMARIDRHGEKLC